MTLDYTTLELLCQSHPAWIGEITFAELAIPLFAIVTDLETGEEVVIQDGPVYQGVRASISVQRSRPSRR